MTTRTLRAVFDAFGRDKKKTIDVSIYAIVHDCQPARKTEGTDFVCRLEIFDESTIDWTGNETIQLLVFAKDVRCLPQHVKAQDVIRVYKQIDVNVFQMKPQLVGKIAADGRAKSSVRVFCHGEEQSSDKEIADHCHWQSEEDRTRVAELRCLLQQMPQMMEALLFKGAYLRKISELCQGPGETVDIICQVLAVDERLGHQVVVHVWDGSDARPMRNDCEAQPAMGRLSQQEPPGPPLCQHALPLRSIPGRDPSSPQQGVQVHLPLPEVGTAVPLRIAREQFERNKQALTVGCYVKIKFLATMIVQGQIQLQFGSRSCIISCGSTDEARSSHAQRMTNNATTQLKHTAFKSRCLCDSDMKPQTVRQLLLSIQRGIPGVFRLNARLSKYIPQDLSDALAPLDGLSLPEEETSIVAARCGHTYAMKVMLEDATGQVDAVLLGEEAEQFFTELPPFDPSSVEMTEKLLEWMYFLVPSSMMDDEHCWLDCCVKLAFLERVSSKTGWIMPCIRIVQTIAQSPWAP